MGALLLKNSQLIMEIMLLKQIDQLKDGFPSNKRNDEEIPMKFNM